LPTVINDGIGDLKGIASKLDYLKDLGVDAIWITPCSPSPQIDFGYNVSDYENIDPMYGTLGDFDLLASEARKRAIHIPELNQYCGKKQRRIAVADRFSVHDARQAVAPGVSPPICTPMYSRTAVGAVTTSVR
jgi:hypothetical protein